MVPTAAGGIFCLWLWAPTSKQHMATTAKKEGGAPSIVCRPGSLATHQVIKATALSYCVLRLDRCRAQLNQSLPGELHVLCTGTHWGQATPAASAAAVVAPASAGEPRRPEPLSGRQNRAPPWAGTVLLCLCPAQVLPIPHHSCFACYTAAACTAQKFQ